MDSANPFQLYFFLRLGDVWALIPAVIGAVIFGLLPSVSTILVGKIFTEFTEFTAQITDSNDFMSKTLKYCTGLFALAGISLIVGWMFYFLWGCLGYQQGHRARKSLYKAYVKNDLTWFDSAEDVSGGLTMSYKDVQDLENFSGVGTFQMISAVTSAICQLGVAFYYSWSVTLVCLAGIPILVLITGFITPRIANNIKEAKSILDDASSRLTFTLGALTTVKVFQKEGWERKLLGKKFLSERKVSLKCMNLIEIQEGVGRFLMLAMFVQGFFFGSYMVRKHGISPGSVMTVFWSCISAAGSIQEVSARFVGLQQGVVAAQRLIKATVKCREAVDIKSSIGTVPASLGEAPSIEFRNVCFSYPSRPEVVLDNLNMFLEAGKTHYIVGPSGSGKSSLASILLKQYPYQRGSVLLNDHRIEVVSDRWVEQTISLVEQEPKLFDIPIVENIRIGSKYPESVSNELIDAAIEQVHADFLYALPQGVHTKGGISLSGGQRQRICLARAWISDSPIMIFDESTSALEPALQNIVMQNILKLRKDKTTIIITHNLELIPRNEPLFFFVDGTAERFDNVPSLLASGSMKTENAVRHTISDAKRRSVYLANPEKSKDEFDFEKEKDAVTITAESVVTEETTVSETSPVPSAGISVHMKLFRLIDQKFLLLVGAICICVHAAINPVFAFVFSKLIMGLVPDSSVNVLLWAMMVLLCAFADGFTSYLKIIIYTVGETWQQTTRMRLIDTLLARSYLNKEQSSYYKKLIISDIEKIMEVITTYWAGIMNVIVIGSLGLIWAAASGWKLTLVGIAISPVAILTAYFHKLVSTKFHRHREKSRAELMRFMDDISANFRTVKAHKLEKYFESYYFERESVVWNSSLWTAVWIGLGFGFIHIFIPAAQGILLYYGMKLTSTGEYSGDKTMRVFSLLVFSLVTMENIMSTIPSVGNGFEAVSRLIPALETNFESEHDIPVSPYSASSDESSPNDIEFKQVSVSSSRGQILQDFNIRIECNKAVAIIGPSGSGKTTIAKLLMGLQQPTAGSIKIGGRRIQEMSLSELREQVSLVEQMPLNFFDGSIQENVAYGVLNWQDSSDISNLVQEACRKSGADGFIRQLEHGYDTVMKSGSFSGGQLQRLGIARALLRNPKVLILDEPTSALDSENRERIKSLILDLKQSQCCTLIIITHQADVAALADKSISFY